LARNNILCDRSEGHLMNETGSVAARFVYQTGQIKD
jgi:hypothetical protein